MQSHNLSSLFLPQFEVQIKQRLLQLLSHINPQLCSDHLFVARLHPQKDVSEVIAHLRNGEVAENFIYELKGTPCAAATDERGCAYADDICSFFPEDLLLKDMDIKGYLGVPLIGAEGKTIGILVSLYKRKVEQIDRHMFLFETFANLIMSELNNLVTGEDIKAHMDLLNAVGEMTSAGGWQFDLTTNELVWTQEVYRIYGLPTDLKVTPDIGIRHYSERAQKVIKEHFTHAITNGKSYCLELPFKDALGNKKWVRTNGKVQRDGLGKIVRVFGVLEDITEEKSRLVREREQKDYLTAILDNLNDAVMAVDEQGVIVQSNQVALSMFGYKMEELIGMSIASLMPEPYAIRHQGYMDEYKRTGQAKIMGIGRQLSAIRKNGEVFQMELSLSEAMIAGQCTFIGVIRDISEKLKAQDMIYKLAYNDRITGLPNKLWFEKEMQDLLIRAKEKSGFVYCSLVDIDNLAHVNLSYSKVVGDHVIRSIAEQLQLLAVDHFKLYKSGADSFYLACTDVMTAEQLSPFKHANVEALLSKYSQTKLHIANAELTVSFCRGSVIFDAANTQVESLVDMLEYAKNKAKSQGNGHVFFVDKDAKGSYERVTALRHELKSAVKNKELFLLMQPQYGQDCQLHGAEALLRWKNPKLGMVPPDEFIPLAEQSDLILEIGDWVIDEVCRHMHALNQDGKKVTVSINISAKQIVNTDFKYKLVSAIKRWQIDSRDLILELTETTLVSSISLVKKVMEELRSQGFRFSIDDFGTGYSSLAYLKTLPISELKIDRCFVHDLKPPFNMVDISIVNMIIDMARALNVKTVAEGVENLEQMEYLKSRDCTYFQGFYLSKPITIEQWKTLNLVELETNA